MEYTINESGDSHEIMMQGTFGFADNVSVEELVESLAGKRAASVTLNLTGVEKIDSAGLGMIVLIKDEVEDGGGRFAVRGASGQVKKMLDISRFDQLMTVEG